METLKERTVKEAAALLDVTEGRIRAMLDKSRLSGRKVAGIWLITDASIQAAKARKPGYPKGRKRT